MDEWMCGCWIVGWMDELAGEWLDGSRIDGWMDVGGLFLIEIG